MNAANTIPETESTAKKISSSTALMKAVFCVNGPYPRPVSTVAMAATRRVASEAPLIPKRMAAQITNGSTAKAITCSFTDTRALSVKMATDVSVRRSSREISSASRLQRWIFNRLTNVKTRGVISNPPVASPSQ
jgi:hypothetical protein